MGAPLSPLDFILQSPVFRLEEFVAAYEKTRESSAHARDALAYHVKEGRLLNLKRGLYAHAGVFVDPYLVASKLAKEVVISHDGALSFHGVTGLGHRVSFMTSSRSGVLRFNDVIFQPFRIPKGRMVRSQQFERGGQPIFVTSLSTAFVDCLANLERSPPPIELLGHFRNSLGKLNPTSMISHALTFDSPLLVSRLGYFLSCAGCELDVADVQHLNGGCLEEPTYFQRSTRTKEDFLIARWNLIVSPELGGCWPR